MSAEKKLRPGEETEDFGAGRDLKKPQYHPFAVRESKVGNAPRPRKRPLA